ncbi:MAG: arylformamidase [Betaproteobacteria bacterium]|nr:arylformamidase [Betaproteobacteria bacterium]
MQKLWDISPPVEPGSPVFEGDTSYAQQWSWQISRGSPVNVAAVTLSGHVGAHADGPLHYDPGGRAVGELPLEPYIGPCRVIHALHGQALVGLSDLAHALDRLPPRVLIRTYPCFPLQRFDPRFRALEATLIEELADRGVLLVGLDSASVDPVDSKDLPSHQALRRRDLRVLENLYLDDVPEGDYELIALPLRWMRADASPVRAVLRCL